MKRVLLAALALVLLHCQAWAGSALSTVTVSDSLTMTSPSALISGTGPTATISMTNGYFRNISATFGVGKAIQAISASVGTVVTLTTTAVPNDNTVPQAAEGTDFLTLTVTPLRTGSTLDVTYNIEGCGAAGGSWVMFATQDAVTNALPRSIGFYANSGSASCSGASKTFTLGGLTAGVATTLHFKSAPFTSTPQFYVNGNTSGNPIYGGNLGTSANAYEVVP